jgi:prostaglandin-H2 D-isomerase / glutathione transferase
MKIFYFDIAGRAELARMTLRYGDVDFEDVRFSGEDWRAKYKAMAPLGQAPFMELDDGTILAQSGAMTLYVAERAGALPADATKRAQAVELMMTIEDVRPRTRTTLHQNG